MTSLSWGFSSSFPQRFIHLVMSCVTSVSLSVLVNGAPTLPFKPTRGIRRGDPISPFLFLLCAEGLSSLIRYEQSCGREVLNLGMRYRVQTGERISIWEDPWIPRPYSFKPCATFRSILPAGRVADLVNVDTGSWNTSLLAQLFLPFDMEIILSIPLGHVSDLEHDAFIWHHTNHGRYTVKSGYHTLMKAQRETSERGQPAEDHNNRRLWTNVWAITTLPKVRVFLWKALHSALPTGQNLQKRISAVVAECGICQTVGETEFHCLIACPVAKQVWERTFPILAGWIVNSFESVFTWALNSLDREALCYFSLLCWFLWKSQCSRVFDGIPQTTNQIIMSASGLAAELLDADSTNVKNSSPKNAPCTPWNLPPIGTIAINVDAGFGEDGVRACGYMIRDHTGNIINASSSLLRARIDVLHGELLAILHGLHYAREFQHPKVEIWSDCLPATLMLQHDDEPLHPLATLVRKCLSLKSEFAQCSIFYTRREYNYPAHFLARLGVLHSTSINWESNPPPYVMDAAIADLL